MSNQKIPVNSTFHRSLLNLYLDQFCEEIKTIATLDDFKNWMFAHEQLTDEDKALITKMLNDMPDDTFTKISNTIKRELKLYNMITASGILEEDYKKEKVSSFKMNSYNENLEKTCKSKNEILVKMIQKVIDAHAEDEKDFEEVAEEAFFPIENDKVIFSKKNANPSDPNEPITKVSAEGFEDFNVDRFEKKGEAMISQLLSFYEIQCRLENALAYEYKETSEMFENTVIFNETPNANSKFLNENLIFY